MLDFGCGSGRVLRHFAELSKDVELWGCDIDRPSIEWLQEHLSPPLHVLTNDKRPPLDLPSEHFDLIYAISVFTHLTEEWSSWLLELRRLLKPGGLLVATFLGAGAARVLEPLAWHEPWEEERVGMHLIALGTPWDLGGPCVMHGRWWIEAHWSRAFEILSLSPGADGRQGMLVGRKTSERAPTREELERFEPGEPREVEALVWSLRQAHAEIVSMRAQVHDADAQLARIGELERELELEVRCRDSGVLRRILSGRW